MSDQIMEPIRTHPNVTTLKRTHLPAAIGVLTNAFTDDPLMNTLFAVSTSPFERSLKELMRFSCEVRLLLDWPLLGYWDNTQQLVGVAGLSLPGKPNWPPALKDVYAQLETVIGAESRARLEAYSQQADNNRPGKPHYQLGLIGVDPQHGGNGFGSELMRAFHRMADANPSSTGIWLDTENPRNVPWYQKHGYQILAETPFHNLTIWGMFRPKA
jgi:ribosomal protein S18 acetylase RimI-like enzyme